MILQNRNITLKLGNKEGKKTRFMYNRMSDKAKILIRDIQYDDSRLNLIFKEETSDK